MLWLAWAVYSGTGKSPDELADDLRLANAAVVEHHLLAEFVPAVYPDSKDRSAGDRLHRLLSAPFRSQPRRWLAFMASDKHLHSDPGALQRRQPLDLFETRDVQSVAWWRFTGAAGGFRMVSVAARGALLGFALWKVIQFVLQRNGNWRNGSYAGPIHFREMFLSGPLGRSIWPTIDDLIGDVPARTRQQAFSYVTRYSGDLFKPYPLWVYISGIVIVSLYIYIFAYSEPYRPKYLRIRPKLPLACLSLVLRSVIFVAAIMWVVTIVWHRPGFAATFFTTRATWYAILAIGLAMSVSGFPAKLIFGTDVVGAVNPIESLRLDRWADAFVTSSRRAIFAGVVLLFSGPELALAYLAFAVTSTFVALVLGGRSGRFASRSYTDACIWFGLTRRMPQRPMRFLGDAARRGVFQEIGALYRFRHARVQLQLRDWYEDYRPGIRHWQPRQLRLLGWLQAYTGDRATTLAGARDRVDGYRALADRNMAEFGRDLANALIIEVSFLRELRYQEQELDALMQLVATYRRLAELGADREPDLAGSLDQFAHRLADAGRYGEASEAMTEAVEIYCRLVSAEPDKYQPQLASSLLWLDRASQPNGHPAAAARAFKTVLNKYRQLVQDECRTEPVRCATSLVQLADLLEQLGRSDDAADAINDAVKIRGRLAGAGPTPDRAAHAASVAKLAVQLEQFGREDDAAAALARSTDTYRELAQLASAKYQLPFIASLDRLAALSAKVHRQAELPLIREAVSEYRAMAAEKIMQAPGWDDAAPGPPARHDSGGDVYGLSMLSRFALRLWQLDMRDEAVVAADIGRQLTEASPQGRLYTSAYAWAWRAPLDPSAEPVRPGEITLVTWLRRLVSIADWPGEIALVTWLLRLVGIADWEEARARRWRSLVEEHDRRAFQFLVVGRGDESQAEAQKAAECCSELVAVYEHLANTKPDQYLADLADSQDLLARQLRKTGQDAAGAEAARKAQRIRRRLGLELRAKAVPGSLAATDPGPERARGCAGINAASGGRHGTRRNRQGHAQPDPAGSQAGGVFPVSLGVIIGGRPASRARWRPLSSEAGSNGSAW